MSSSGDNGMGKRLPLHAIVGGRVALERELLWLVALGGDPARIEALSRTLAPAANHALSLMEPVAELWRAAPDRAPQDKTPDLPPQV